MRRSKNSLTAFLPMSKYFRPALFVLALFLVISSFLQKPVNLNKDDVILEAPDSISSGTEVMVNVINNGKQSLTIPSSCPKNPLKVERYTNGELSVVEGEVTPCTSQLVVIEPGKSYKISYGLWNHLLFAEEGKYRISVDQTIDGKTKVYSKDITITPPGVFTTFFRTVFYKPIFNTLIFLIATLPNHDLGWAIILLTLIIKVILLVPNQKALKAQKKMQKIQPELDALKLRYKDDQKKLAEETMLIWKKYKVNPTSSCLPMLIQFPILIALFYVVKDGLGYIDPKLLYTGLQGFNAASIQTIFLGIIDLTKLNPIVLPILIGLLQFGQMRLTIGKSSKNQPSAASAMPAMNQTMMYIMPVMIAIFTARVPAAVGFYWGTSTLFGIVQQMVVNRSKD